MRYILLFSVLFLIACESAEERSDRFFNLGNQALANGEYEQAIQLFNESIKEVPNNAAALNNRGVAKMETDHPYEAILDYNQAIQIQSDYLDALFNRAYAYEEIGQYDKSLRDVDQIQLLVQDSAFVYFYQGLVLTKMRTYDRALESFVIADRLNPLNPETLVNMATLFYFKNQYDTAIAILNDAMELSPNDANVFSLSSLIALEKGNQL